jgi:hypothetical protein
MVSVLKLGRLVATRNAIETIPPDDIKQALTRYMAGDWGITSQDGSALNNKAIETGDDRILAVYNSSDGRKFWIITEHDRSFTTILLPGEY